jgi:hypothetical protein
MDLSDRATDPLAWLADLVARVVDPVARVPAPFARVLPPFAPSRAPFRRAPANEARVRPNERSDRANERRDRVNERRDRVNERRDRVSERRDRVNERRDRVNEREVAANEARAPVPFAHSCPCVGRTFVSDAASRVAGGKVAGAARPAFHCSGVNGPRRRRLPDDCYTKRDRGQTNDDASRRGRESLAVLASWRLF